jgi:signal transduction histidine kinase
VFHSIRWRLVLSYAAITLLTVVVLGLVAFSLILESIEAQETATLEANAQVVAQQAAPLMQPFVRLDELEELARMTGYLADLRVRILSPSSHLLVDTGSPVAVGRFYWITPHGMPHLQMTLTEFPDGLEPMILTIPGSEEGVILIPPDLPHSLREAIDQDLNIQTFTRMGSMWGPRLTVEDAAPLDSAFTSLASRSPRQVEVPIGASDRPVGFVQVMEARSIRTEAIEATLPPFLLAAAGAMTLAISAGVFIGHRLSSPVINLTQTAKEMGAGDLSVRTQVTGKDEIGQLGAQFNLMADRMEASFREVSSERDTLRRFIADASHELRTPLTALRNFIELLGGPDKPDRRTRQSFLSDSMTQVERMEWITRNLLDISRIEAGITSLSMDAFSTRDMVESVSKSYHAAAEARRITISYDLPDEDLQTEGDRRLLELALSNLIDNALKFTPEEGEIIIGAMSAAPGTCLWVQDSGIGIHADELDHIFERFYRGRKHGVEGSGLGLAFTKTVIDAHQGEVEVESEPGRGTTVRLLIPAPDRALS